MLAVTSEPLSYKPMVNRFSFLGQKNKSTEKANFFFRSKNKRKQNTLEYFWVNVLIASTLNQSVVHCNIVVI